MVNLIGEKGYQGTAVYEGLQEVLEIENAFVHIYGKVKTSPGRKMGHITIIHHDKTDLLRQANKVKRMLKVKSEI
jgi:5-(carboxyamino)imidazole ribonucleotide synthase